MMKEKNFDEQEILKRLVKGDRDAFVAIYYAYWDYVYYFILRISRSREIAEDITQEIFTAMWDKRKDFKNVEYLKTYLSTASRNMALRQLKRAMLLSRVENKFLHDHGLNQSDHNLENNILESEYNEIVLKTVSQLTQRQQEIFKYSREYGLSHAEIAAKLDISPVGVKKHIAVICNILRQRLKNHLAYLLFVLSVFNDSPFG